MSRSRGSKTFEERLRASIEQVGLVEPIKVALLPNGQYLVIDGIMRLEAISAIRLIDSAAFETVPAYVVEYGRRFEIRYQTDIYQDLLPSQLAGLVEHLHRTENVRKADIARFIGVSPPTVRNYTGLWRMMQRGGLFARIVELMDVGVFPSSNPYAWLRLNAKGLRYVLETRFTDGESAEVWIEGQVARARQSNASRFPNKFVEDATNGLAPEHYREAQEVREQKRDLGLRRGVYAKVPKTTSAAEALKHLASVSKGSPEPVMRTAARSLAGYLK